MNVRLFSTISRQSPLSAQRSFLDAEWDVLHGFSQTSVHKDSKDHLAMNQFAMAGKLVGSKRRVHYAHQSTFPGIA